jgi:hypothetical protein
MHVNTFTSTHHTSLLYLHMYINMEIYMDMFMNMEKVMDMEIIASALQKLDLD